MATPTCNGSNITHIVREAVGLTFSTDAATYCNCTRRCHNMQYNLVSHMADKLKDQTVLTYVLQHSFVIKFVERIAYGYSDLLCEIGGNLGLNLGLSLLSIIQVNFVIARRLLIKNKLKLTDPISAKVRSEFTSCYKAFKMKVVKTKSRPIRVLFKLLILIVCLVASCCFIDNRIVYYFSEPTRVLVTGNEENIVEFPNVVVCGDSRKVTNEKLKWFKKNKNHVPDCKNVDLKLIDIIKEKKSSKAVDFSDYWQLSSMFNDYADESAVAQIVEASGDLPAMKATKSAVLLPDGNCTQFALGTQKYLGRPASFATATIGGKVPETSCQKEYRTVYYGNKGERLDPGFQFLQPIGTFFALGFRTEQVQLLNTRSHPCVNSEVFNSCWNMCWLMRIQSVINCSLPYMELNDLPPCKTIATAKEANEAYEMLSMTMDPIKDCHCIRSCNKTIYKATVLIIHFTDIDVSLLALYFDSNVVIRYTEAPKYSFSALLCDIGGNLGLTLGLSVLSLFEMFQALFIKFYNFISFFRKSG